jgi:hypothetical protein
MPFNMMLAGVGGRTFVLEISAGGQFSYDIESEVISQYGITGTQAADNVVLNITGTTLIASTSTSLPAIDGTNLDPAVNLTINIGASVVICGKGGTGGVGGTAEYDFENKEGLVTNGGPGGNGGVAMKYGCPTTVLGSGTIIKGWGGGGGGAGRLVVNTPYGGCGGGGGAAYGTAGSGGIATGPASVNGVAGSSGDLYAGGAGGSYLSCYAGGDGGGSGGAAQAGSGSVGGAAGSDGAAIDSNGQTYTHAGTLTITGTVI